MESAVPAARSRSVTWNDPRVALASMRTLAGLDYLKLVVAGQMPAPPMASLMNIRLTEVDRGRAVFETVPEEYHYNPLGMVHGGLAATILDSAMGCAVHSSLDAGDRYTTIEIKVNYLKAMSLETGRVRAIGTLVHIGRTTALAEGKLVGADGVLYAHGTSTLLIKRTDQRSQAAPASTSSAPSE
jgi:uncharacterized protein (TIGR00369 family)